MLYLLCAAYYYIKRRLTTFPSTREAHHRAIEEWIEGMFQDR